MNATTLESGQKRVLTYRECAESLGVCQRTVWGLVRSGTLRSMRIGRSVRIPIAELDRYIAQQCEQG